jgi:hypothetical protein
MKYKSIGIYLICCIERVSIKVSAKKGMHKSKATAFEEYSN